MLNHILDKMNRINNLEVEIMPVLEDYIDKKPNFDHFFENFTVAIVTEDYYNYPNKEYETIYIDLHSKLKERKGEVDVFATRFYLELHQTIDRGIMRSSLPPQIIDYDMNDTILVYPGEDLFVDDWDMAFELKVLEAVKQNFKSYIGLCSSGDEKSYTFRIRDIYIVE